MENPELMNLLARTGRTRSSPFGTSTRRSWTASGQSCGTMTGRWRSCKEQQQIELKVRRLTQGRTGQSCWEKRAEQTVFLPARCTSKRRST